MWKKDRIQWHQQCSGSLHQVGLSSNLAGENAGLIARALSSLFYKERSQGEHLLGSGEY